MPAPAGRRSGHFWIVLAAIVFSVIYLALQLGFVRPYLWPAGHGLLLAGDSRLAGGSGERAAQLARPPEPAERPIGAAIVRAVAVESPAGRAGMRAGDEILGARNLQTGASVDLRSMPMAAPAEQMRAWRSAYWMGLKGPIRIRVAVARGDRAVEQTVDLDRPAAWRASSGVLAEWARRHLGMVVQLVVFIGSAASLLMLRSMDRTAAFASLALALSAAGGAGPLMGSERGLPPIARELMTVFAWIAAPLAFPAIALAILYFPRPSPLLARAPWLHAAPFAAAAPMIATSAATGLFLAGVNAAEGWATWDASHPQVYYGSFAAALGVNLIALGEGIWRFRTNPDANERRRISLLVWTASPGIIAYAVKDGLPAVARLVGGGAGRYVELPWWLAAFLQLLVLLPAFALTYTVAVHRVLGPRRVLRRSLQYALARRTLAALAILPASALAISLARQSNRPLAAIVTGRPLFYTGMTALVVLALRYRERARLWLDRRFFREEYDAREILLSLASRVPFETDPNDLSAIVLEQIDRALHPQLIAILATGIEEGRLTPVAVLHGSAESLAVTGGLATMLRWSEEPMEIDLGDTRAPVRRLPADEQEWLECTRAALMVPILTKGAGERERALTAVLVLGEKRAEEPYTAEDRQLLAAISTQMGLGFDVARLRRRLTDSEIPTALGTAEEPSGGPMLVECPRCGRAAADDTPACPNDGSPMKPVPALSHVIERKYRMDQLIGRGGMGAVYRARDVRLDRDVAIKVLRAQLLDDAAARMRFRREAQIVACLQHPFIVSIFDYGTLKSGSAYLVMEFVRGDDLRRVLQREGAFEPERALRLLGGLCSAIDAAHREGVLHRDLKPENILLPRGGVELKVLDFGVAKLVAEHARETGAETLTLDGQTIGTPAYMAPEQLRGAAADARTDVFALGVMAYELLTGDLPFGKGSVFDIAAHQTQGAPPMRSERGPIAPELERAVRAAVEPDPERRPRSPMEFASLLGVSR